MFTERRSDGPDGGIVLIYTRIPGYFEIELYVPEICL